MVIHVNRFSYITCKLILVQITFAQILKTYKCERCYIHPIITNELLLGSYLIVWFDSLVVNDSLLRSVLRSM